MTPTQDYGSYGTGQILRMYQTAIQGISANAIIVGPMTLTPGLWLVSAMFLSGRLWQSGTGHAVTQLRAYLTGPGGAVINGSPDGLHIYGNVYQDGENEQRSSASPITLVHILEVTSNYNVEMWGGSAMVVGSNFAGGWRWDSGSERPSVLEAVKLR